MNGIKLMVHSGLRDDTTLRTLLGHSADPYGVYQAMPPESLDLSTKSYVTWQFIQGVPEDTDAQGDPSMRRRHRVVSITAWSEDPDTVDSIHVRVRRIMIGAYGLTKPSSLAEVHGVTFEGDGPDLFDDEKKVYFRAETYRISFREDIAA